MVTKFSGCFAFGKKPKATTESGTSKTSKYLQKSKKTMNFKEIEESKTDLVSNSTITPSTSTTTATSIHDAIVNASSPTSIPNFDNIYQHLMKHNSNEFQIKRPTSSQSSPVNNAASLTPQQNSYYSQMDSSALSATQAGQELLNSPESHNRAMTPLPTMDDHSNASSSHTPYCGDMRQATPMSPGTFI